MKVEFDTITEAKGAIKKIQNWIDATEALTADQPRRRKLVDPDVLDDAILLYLGENPGATTRDIFEHVETGLQSPSSMHHIMKRLKEAGEITQTNKQKRNQRWKLTPGKVMRIRPGEGVVG